ncbi:hypothetical protein WK39_17000 [Burkholderia cepacia]|nr:hypothetical protein WK40_32970 [Burkholderia cepacia]KVS58982.1 hypothetical protein WK39_17000 [Burkholderia cepacia]CAG9269920.1 hypothetical protein BCEP4_590016 [Burkholderia cepacia]
MRSDELWIDSTDTCHLQRRAAIVQYGASYASITLGIDACSSHCAVHQIDQMLTQDLANRIISISY